MVPGKVKYFLELYLLGDILLPLLLLVSAQYHQPIIGQEVTEDEEWERSEQAWCLLWAGRADASLRLPGQRAECKPVKVSQVGIGQVATVEKLL